METSLRYGGDSKALRIHAKEKFPFDSRTHFQVHGELDTRIGAPSQFTALIRHFYPDLYTNLGVGLQYSKHEKLRYVVRGKISFPMPSNSLVSLNIKGRCDLDKELKQRKSTGAVELSWGIFNFRQDQDVRLKLGYEVFDQSVFVVEICSSQQVVFHYDSLFHIPCTPWQMVPYMQIRENNWTLNADINGRWNVRFDL